MRTGGALSRLLATFGAREAGKAPVASARRGERPVGHPCIFCGGQHAKEIVCGMMSDEDAWRLVGNPRRARAG
jgi:hypothetical protein